MPTRIEWADETWNPTLGCMKVSAGCEQCYAIPTAYRQEHAFKRPEYAGTTRRLPNGSLNWTGRVQPLPERLKIPLQWRSPRRVFVDSMSDLFHEDVPDWFIFAVWTTIAQTPWHTYQVLTKRPKRMVAWFGALADVGATDVEPVGSRDGRTPGFPSRMSQADADRVLKSGRARMFHQWVDTWGEPPPGAARPTYDWLEGPRWWPTILPNLWLGVSVEDQAAADERIPLLLQTPAAVRFLSCEPLLGRVDLWSARYRHSDGWLSSAFAWGSGINWVIAGGESGPNHRPLDLDWVRFLRDQCRAAGAAFHFKQVGGRTHAAGGRLLDGRTWDEFPAVR